MLVHTGSDPFENVVLVEEGVDLGAVNNLAARRNDVVKVFLDFQVYHFALLSIFACGFCRFVRAATIAKRPQQLLLIGQVSF